MDVKQILDDLDKHAAEFNFPVLDNAYVDYAAARLTAFRSETDWLIIFEVLGFSTREVQFVDDLYAYGSCVTHDGFIGEEVPFVPSAKQPLFDSTTNSFVADWRHWAVNYKGKDLSFSPALSEYRKAGISIADGADSTPWREVDLLRFLAHTLGEDLFLPDGKLLARFPKCGMMPIFIRSQEWQHPDISGEERPSQNVSMTTLLDALSSRNPAVFQLGRPNTHWSFWVNR
jgi:hypothetical protein